MELRERLKALGVDLDRLAELCDRWKIAEVTPFGSALRDDFRPDSDIDLLVTYRADADWSLFDTAGLDAEFAELFHRPVDVVNRRAVEASPNWIRRKAILENGPSMPRDAANVLDIVLACQRIVEFRGLLGRAAFLADEKSVAATFHQFMMMGEAVERLSDGFRGAHPNVPGRRIAGMRDRLIHGYNDVDPDQVWNAVESDVPTLLAYLAPLLPKP
jgi:uncharacterized protein with HEPN domain/predicted nucleotidyltransferase